MKISLQNIHNNFSKFIGLINLSNRYITIENTFFSSESIKDHVENLLRAQQEKQEHFLSTVANVKNPSCLALVIL